MVGEQQQARVIKLGEGHHHIVMGRVRRSATGNLSLTSGPRLRLTIAQRGLIAVVTVGQEHRAARKEAGNTLLQAGVGNSPEGNVADVTFRGSGGDQFRRPGHYRIKDRRQLSLGVPIKGHQWAELCLGGF